MVNAATLSEINTYFRQNYLTSSIEISSHIFDYVLWIKNLISMELSNQ